MEWGFMRQKATSSDGRENFTSMNRTFQGHTAA